MSVCIRIKMKSEYIFDMLLYHMYSRLSGNSVRYGWTQVQRAVATPKDIVLMTLIVGNMEREQVYIR